MALPPTDDTIAAIATANGPGAVGIVRVSGPGALTIGARLFRPAGGAAVGDLAGHTAAFGRIVTPDDPARVLDEALLLVFRAPRSYTGQDAVEFQTHGGAAVLRAVLDACLEAGARAAGPGEFTLRAYLEGRLDLAQAESVLGIVHATTERARRSAAHGLTAALSGKIGELQSHVTRAYGSLQAALDYPEEGVPEAELDVPLQRALDGIDALLATARAGRIAERGARLALVGRPNAGKSSLLNALLGYERSIVSEAPGTTRDYLEAPLEIGGVPVTAIDTAGIRRTDDAVEATGVERARDLAASADVTLLLLDRARPRDDDDAAMLAALDPERSLVVATKIDLPAAWDPSELERPVLAVAAPDGTGLDALRTALEDVLVGDAAGHEFWITNERHAQALRDAREAVVRAREAPADLAAMDLEQALRALAAITGRDEIAEETLEHIFASFCVGK